MQKLADNILSWCAEVDALTLQQAANLAAHPALIGNVCLMPDAHCGYGMPIGGVAALDGAVSPNMVGVDIGCGMLAVKTSYTQIARPALEAAVNLLYERIPLGFAHHETAQENDLFKDLARWEKTTVCKREYISAQKQVGTLGGGNHFIEIQRGDDGHIWFMIHSGSRNLGAKVAEYYNDLAVQMCSWYRRTDVVKNNLAFLPVGTREAGAYITEMKLCLDFSFENRRHMARCLLRTLEETIGKVQILDEINIHHNYAACEEHYGRKVWVHRKGAVLAARGVRGIIPGSQGTASYIVEGLGSEAALQSSSHGAGRKMSRRKAIENLDLKKQQAILDGQGILHRMNTQESLEEAPAAYKDIEDVLSQEADLVRVLVKLQPLAVIKGT